ncbi:hypothetical protein Hanom_Chr04g00344491 [Helianthus anomalus]
MVVVVVGYPHRRRGWGISSEQNQVGEMGCVSAVKGWVWSSACRLTGAGRCRPKGSRERESSNMGVGVQLLYMLEVLGRGV